MSHFPDEELLAEARKQVAAGWVRTATSPEFPHGAMWGVDEAGADVVDPMARQILDDLGQWAARLDFGACLHLDFCGNDRVWLSDAATLRLRDKLNAAFPVGD